MTARRPDQEYREADVLSATPERLVVLLYDRMTLDLETAITAQRRGDATLAVDRVHHSQLIVTELAQALDPDRDAELAGNLAALYEYLVHEHRAFLADRDTDHLDDCLKVIRPLYESWRKVAAGSVDSSVKESPERPSHLFSVSA